MVHNLMAIVLIFACWGIADAETQAKVVFIGKEPDHAFGTHMYMHTGKVLSECLTLTNGVQTIVSQGWPEDTSVLDDVSTLVVYMTPAAEFLLDGPHRNQVDVLMKKGVGLVTIHWASSINKESFERIGPKWLSYLGGTWISNVGLHTGNSLLRQLKPTHPICRGWSEYELHDEYYLNPVISDEATPLLQVAAKDKPVTVGWAFERPGGGRSFATTLGHFYRNFQEEAFRRMVINAILWTAQLEIPKSGAMVGLSKEQLALPPQPRK